MFGDEPGYNPSRKTKQLGEIVSREAANKSGETNVRPSYRAELGHNEQKNRYQFPDRYLLFEVLYSLRIDHAIPGAVQNAALGTSTAR